MPTKKQIKQEEAIANALQEEAQSNASLLTEARENLSLAEDARRKYDREWLARDLFRRGYQFVSQNATTGTVTLTSSNRARVPVNLVWAYARSICNQVTSFDPKWEVIPEFKGKRAETDARITGKLMDKLFHKMNMQKKIKEMVMQGLFFSVGGPLEVYWNPNYDNGPNQPRGEVEIILHDPFDIYIDPSATELADANFIVKCVKTPVDEIKNNPLYDKVVRQKLTMGGSRHAQSTYKEFLIQTLQSGASQTKSSSFVILKEMQRKMRKEDGSIKIQYVTWVDELDQPLRVEEMDKEDFDMEVFQADMNPLELYGESWSKHVIALNRVINALESSVFEYNYRYAKGRLLIDKNSGIRAVTNQHGSIIEKNRGAEVRPLPIQPLPSSVENQILRTKAMAEDISGVHEVSLGRTPSGMKAGIAIAELKQSDSTNQDDLVKNLERSLMRIGQKILNLIAQHYTTPHIVAITGKGRMVEHYAVVGKGYVSEDKKDWTIGNEKYPLIQVSGSNELTVQIGTWLAYSKEAQQKVIMNLAEAGFLSKEDVLRLLEFPDVQDVVDRARAEQLISIKRQENQVMPSGVSQEELALAENEMLLENKPAPVDPEQDDHELHIAIHMQILDNQTGNNTVASHIQEHRRAQKGGGMPIQQQQAPMPPQQQPMPPQGQEMPQAPQPEQMQQQAPAPMPAGVPMPV